MNEIGPVLDKALESRDNPAPAIRTDPFEIYLAERYSYVETLEAVRRIVEGKAYRRTDQIPHDFVPGLSQDLNCST